MDTFDYLSKLRFQPPKQIFKKYIKFFYVSFRICLIVWFLYPTVHVLYLVHTLKYIQKSGIKVTLM